MKCNQKDFKIHIHVKGDGRDRFTGMVPQGSR
jgi:hypothetical protein